MRVGRSSLVDVAEDALRRWLATGRHRSGERLPPEQELSARLGISRGTLRTALRRLEESGEIVRRQGSGTFVGQTTTWMLDEGLEKLVSYNELARRRGVALGLGHLEIEQLPLGEERGQLFGLDAETPATTITRVVLLDGAGQQVTEEDGAADTTIKVAWDDWQAMAAGQLDGMTAFMTGKLRIEGDMSNAMQLQGVLSKLRG